MTAWVLAHYRLIKRIGAGAAWLARRTMCELRRGLAVAQART